MILPVPIVAKVENGSGGEVPGHAAGLRRSALFCALALLIGFSFFVRHIAGIVDTHSAYSCLVYNPRSIRETPPANYDFLPDDASWDETRAYARWTNEVLRGELGGATIGSYAPFLTSEVPRQKLWLRDRLGPMLLAGMALLPGSDVRTAFLAADLIFPAGTALALLFLCWELRQSVSFSVAAVSLVMFFNWQDMLNLAAFLRGTPQNSAIFLRTPYPQFSTILLAFFLLFLFRLVQRGTLAAGVPFIVLLVLNFFTYFYSWTYTLVFVGSVCLLLAASAALPQLDLRLPAGGRGKRTFILLVVGTGIAFLLAFPVWRGITAKNPAIVDTFLRLQGSFSHRPELKYSGLLLILFAGLLTWRTSRWTNRWFAMAFLLASSMVLNLQVITGKTIQPGHWTAFYIQPFFLVFLLDFLWRLDFWNSHHTLRRGLPVALLVAGIAINTYKLTVGARQAVEFNRRDPAFEQVLGLLRQPSLRDYGFLSNDFYLGTVLPAYVIQKPLLPWYMDPETNGELKSLQLAASRAFTPELAPSSATGTLVRPPYLLTFRPEKILFVLDLHRAFPDSSLTNRQVLLRNQDFLVLAPLAAP